MAFKFIKVPPPPFYKKKKQIDSSAVGGAFRLDLHADWLNRNVTLHSVMECEYLAERALLLKFFVFVTKLGFYNTIFGESAAK